MKLRIQKKRARRAHRARQRDWYSGDHRRWAFEGFNANNDYAWRLLRVPYELRVWPADDAERA